MTFGELFNPGMANARKQAEAERILPAPAPVASPPSFEVTDLGVDFTAEWSTDEEDARGDDNGEPAAADSPSSES